MNRPDAHYTIGQFPIPDYGTIVCSECGKAVSAIMKNQVTCGHEKCRVARNLKIKRMRREKAKRSR